MLGEKIKKYRESKNMTQGEIADILGVKAATISKYEAGTLEPNIESLKRLADLFEVSVDELIKEDSFDISKINILEVLKEQKNMTKANIQQMLYFISTERQEDEKKIDLYNTALFEASKFRLDIFMKLILY